MNKLLENKTTLIILSIIIIIIGVVIIGRLVTSEDTWICRDGEWIKHGVPYSPKPTTGCGTQSDSNANPNGNIDQWPKDIIPCTERSASVTLDDTKNIDCEIDEYCQLVQTGSCPQCADQVLKCEPTDL